VSVLDGHCVPPFVRGKGSIDPDEAAATLSECLAAEDFGARWLGPEGQTAGRKSLAATML
jgi:hypothetical protein